MLKVYSVEKSDHHYWTLHDLLLELRLYLEDTYEAQIIMQKGGVLYVPELGCEIGDSEIVIYDEDVKNIKIISFSESRSRVWDSLIERNNSKDLLLLAHTEGWGLQKKDLKSSTFKINTTTFYPFSPKMNYDFFYRQRKLVDFSKQENKLFFHTSGRGDQEMLAERGVTNPILPLMDLDQYLYTAIHYKAGLAIAGVAEICHRDLEYMAIGVPMLRLEYIQEYDPLLIANYHYIAVSREDIPLDAGLDQKGGERYVEAYAKRFAEVKDDEQFLKFISNNARKYYENYCSPLTRLTYILSKLAL